MSTGSDVNVDLWIGEEELLKTFPINAFVQGIWSTSLKISKNYRYPGDYEVKAAVSNSTSSVILKKNITVMSNVSELIVGSKYSPITYLHQSTRDSGRAYFLFSYEGETCAASHSNVSFTIYESNSSYTFGPFWLGMDFIQNISITPFVYDFMTVGNYIGTFIVEDKISSKTLILPIKVKKSINEVNLKVIPPNFIAGMSVIIQVFIEEGDNITLEWFIDGISQGINHRICT
jgi:hypothetical protein